MNPDYSKGSSPSATFGAEPTEGGNLRMRSPFMRLTIGSHINRVPGFFTNINLNWNTNYPYEIALNSTETGKDKDMLVLPQCLDVSCTYQPVHNFLPQKSVNAPFILPHKGDGALSTQKQWVNNPISTQTGTATNYGGQTSAVNFFNEGESERTQK